MKNTVKAILIVATLTGVAHAADVLTGKNGRTLYTFDADGADKSACGGGCLALWPAARPGDATGKEFGQMTRDDGSKQLTLQGKPLYYYVNDKKAGDATGDNINNVWHVAGTNARKQSANSGPYNNNGY